MPELPEVEQFRKMLLPLVSQSQRIQVALVETTKSAPPRVWLSPKEVAFLNERYMVCINVLRKGKQLCLVLQSLMNRNTKEQEEQFNEQNDNEPLLSMSPQQQQQQQQQCPSKEGQEQTCNQKGKETDDDNPSFYYLLLHMGMTGSIQSPGISMSWGHEGSLKTTTTTTTTTTKKKKPCQESTEGENGQEPLQQFDNMHNNNNKNDDDDTQGNNDDIEEKEQYVYPPKYTYLTIQTGNYRAAFSDPRKFGKCQLVQDLSTSFDELAPDALTCGGDGDGGSSSSSSTSNDDNMKLDNNNNNKEFIVHDTDSRRHALDQLVNQSIGIKSLLLDQRRAVSGVGNWVADEVLYQIQMHPDQAYLTRTQAVHLLDTLVDILTQAVHCLELNHPYPSTWLFPYRWVKAKNQNNKKKKTTTTQNGETRDNRTSSNNSTHGKDSKGQSLTFIKSGGRTSAIVLSKQKLFKRKQGPILLTNDKLEEGKMRTVEFVVDPDTPPGSCNTTSVQPAHIGKRKKNQLKQQINQKKEDDDNDDDNDDLDDKHVVVVGEKKKKKRKRMATTMTTTTSKTRPDATRVVSPKTTTTTTTTEITMKIKADTTTPQRRHLRQSPRGQFVSPL